MADADDLTGAERRTEAGARSHPQQRLEVADAAQTGQRLGRVHRSTLVVPVTLVE